MTRAETASAAAGVEPGAAVPSGGSPRRGRVFYGWWIVGAGIGVQSLIAAFFMQVYGSYAAIFESQFGWSKTSLSWAFSMTHIESGALGPLQGWMIDRFGPRMVMRVGMLMLGVGLMLFSQIDSLLTFYLVFFFMAVGQSLGGFLALTVAVVHWFERRRATALGVMQTGFAVGGLVLPLVAWALVNVGWRETAFGSGVLVLLLGLPLCELVRHSPEPYGYHRDGISDEEAERREREERAAEEAAGWDFPAQGADFTSRDALRTPAFWLISLGHGFALLVVGAMMVHMVLHLTGSLGYTLVQANFVFQLIAVMQVIGQVGGGLLGDRFSKRVILAACMLGHGAGVLLLAFASSLWMVVGFAVLHGLAWGVRGPLQQALRADYFGRRSFGTIMGFSSLVTMFGMIVGPVMAGMMADRTGRYESSFVVLAVLAALGSVFFLLSTPPRRRRGRAALPTAQPGRA